VPLGITHTLQRRPAWNGHDAATKSLAFQRVHAIVTQQVRAGGGHPTTPKSDSTMAIDPRTSNISIETVTLRDYLSREEVENLSYPLRQNAARHRFFERQGYTVERRPDGSLIVFRKFISWKNESGPQPRWSR
jgi:hypothetical protein